MPSQEEKPKWANYARKAGLIFFIFLIICLPRLLVVDKSVTVDEHKWLQRSWNFSYAVDNGIWSNSYQTEHPGVSAMWAGALGLNILFLQEAISTDFAYQPGLRSLLQPYGLKMMDALIPIRIIMVLLNGLLLTIAFIYARRLLGTAAAVIGFLLIAFNPFHAAHTHILHLDGLAGSFIFLSALAFLSYGESQRWRDLIISGIAAGLGWLTKTPAAAIIPTIIILSCMQILVRHKNGNGAWRQLIGRSLLSSAVWLVIGGVTFSVIWPVMWVSPGETIYSIFSNAFLYASGGHYQAIFFNGEIFSGNENLAQLRSFYPSTFLWRSTIVGLTGLVAAVVAFLRRLPPLDSRQHRAAVLGLFLFVLIFVIIIGAGAKKFDRYILPVYAPLDLIAAVGWVSVAKWLSRLWSGKKGHLAGDILLIAIIVIQASFLVRAFPYYLSYYNPLVGGNRRAPEVMMIGWGEGLDAAARYLNQKPNGSELSVASWYGPSFAYFFDGETLDVLSEVDPDLAEKIFATDYIIVYAHQWQRELPSNILDILRPLTPEYVVWHNDLEYARVYATP